jgi:hypothetical protein
VFKVDYADAKRNNAQYFKKELDRFNVDDIIISGI